MGDTSIRVSDDVKRRLELEKREDESFEDVIRRLTSTDKWRGFGVLSEEAENTRDGMKRMRESMQDGFDDDIENTEGS
jgi:predicted CopG family antitoxin